MTAASGRIKVLFKIGYVYHKAAFDPVIELFRQDDRYDVSFSLEEERIRRFFIKRPYRSPLIDGWEREGYRFTTEKSGFDIVIAGDTIRRAEEYGDALLCFLNHGTGIKNILYRNLAHHPHDRYQVFVEGQYRVDRLKASGALHRSEVHLVGLPKLDYVLQGRYGDRAAILRRWGLDPTRSTVLFAPTYKPTCLYEVKDAIFETTREYNLIVKLHHYSWMGIYAPHAQHRIFERRVRRYPHAILLPVTEYNITPYMAVADTLISEASSTVFDYLALCKFGVIYDLPCDNLKHSDGQPLLTEDNREFLKDAFAHVSSPDQLHDGIERALHPTAAMRSAADRAREYYFYQLDGHASERFKEKVEELYQQRGAGRLS
jgi:CDP-Glycerol:Poly(glycerophosphate) glycerophosphotransferase